MSYYKFVVKELVQAKNVLEAMSNGHKPTNGFFSLCSL